MKISNFQKSYTKRPFLDIPALEFLPEVYWIRGENGAGKSTLLKCLAGLSSFKGEVEIDQVSLKRNPRRYLSYVNYAPTEPVYPDFLTGRQLIDFYKKAKKEQAINIETLLHEFQMSAYIEFQPIAEYSSGMLKKLSLILAMIGKPKVLLLDEPFITLDLQAMDSLKDHLVTFQKSGCTVLLTAHLDSLPIATQIVDLSQYLRTC